MNNEIILEFKKLIDSEINQIIIKDSASNIEREYKTGFINGLKHAHILLIELHAD